MDGATPDRNAEPSARAQVRLLRFDRFVLDLNRGSLLRDGHEVALRPKTFALLHHLVSNAGRLVSKDALLAAVWPRVVVTDDALVQSIGELRRALGDDGASLIKTIPRRGYRFDAEVFADAVPSESVDGPRPEPATGGLAAPALPTAVTRRRVARVVALGVVVLAAIPLGRSVVDRLAGARPEPGAKPAIAVLPLVDHSDEPGRGYFVDGLTQDIINGLGRFSALTVISWNAVSPYKDKPVRPEEAGRRLGVGYLVEGSARQVGDRLRVTAQLVDARRAKVLWSARFDESVADVFALQDTIAAQVVSALAIRVTQIEQRRVFAKPTASLEAYDYVLRARPALQRPTRADIAQARMLLRRAIELDPDYAAAYAALAETFYLAVSMGWAESPTAFMSRAEALATKAVSLDQTEVRGHVMLGRIHIFHQRYRQAENEIERAMALNPNDAQGLAGRGNILMWLGRTDAAIAALEHAQQIDPDLSTMDRFALSLAYYSKRRYDAAIEQALLSLRHLPDASFSRVVLAAALAQDDQLEDATRVSAQIRRTDPTFDADAFGTKFLSPIDLAHLRDGLRKAGLRAGAESR